MPITITVAPPIDTIGPGSELIASSSVQGPWAAPYTWIWTFIQQVTERTMYSTRTLASFPAPVTHRVNWDGLDNPDTVAVNAVIPTGENVHVKVQLQSNLGQIVDSGEITLKWDNSVAQHYDIRDMIEAVTTTGGFTQTDRDQAQITQMAVSLPLPGLSQASDVASGITGFFTNPPPWAMMELDFVDLTGDGDLTRPGAGRQVNAYGAQVAFLSVPPGLGVVLGRPLSYLDRICQLTVVRQGLSQLEYYDHHADFYSSDQRLMWGAPFPQRVSYSVLPGCVVRLFWLHLAPSWWPF